MTAKEVGSLDLAPGGRVLFGIGAGWSCEETRNHGTDSGQQLALMRERTLATNAIWTHEEPCHCCVCWVRHASPQRCRDVLTRYVRRGLS